MKSLPPLSYEQSDVLLSLINRGLECIICCSAFSLFLQKMLFAVNLLAPPFFRGVYLSPFISDS